MSKKRIIIFTIVIFLILSALIGIYVYYSSTGDNNIPSGDTIPPIEKYVIFSNEDQRVDSTDARVINLSDFNNDYIIDKGGDYYLTGELASTLVIDVDENLVHLFLDNVNIRPAGKCCIYVKSASKLMITALPGTVNNLIDKGGYASKAYDACIYSPCDLTINGTGTINVCGKDNDAIHCKDILKVLGIKLYAQGMRDALRANDGIYINNADVTLEATRNGFRTTKTGIENRGSIYITNTKLSVIAGEYAFVSVKDLVLDCDDYYLKSVIKNCFVAGSIYSKKGNLDE